MDGLDIKPPPLRGSTGHEEDKSTIKTTKQPKVGTTSATTEEELKKYRPCDPPYQDLQAFKDLFNQMLGTKQPGNTLDKYAHPAFRDLVAYLNPAMLPWLSEAIEEARAAQLESGEVE